ncbi:hypothetical protein H4R18_000574 [Coemansia javaensis]|uniref:Cation/H+ exchanger transmembrane domain-containing protein n=1 Tax=Coemansia javaensis TaxID=2761396 RepID=A0A9W8HN73_9FUNG|nr:hypothetical protein H4R18_000574 [Coemansia javaensis]
MAGGHSSSVITGRNPVAYSVSDPLALFIIQVLVIVSLCRFLHVFLRRLRQPTVISEVVGGILLGPTVLGRWRAFAENVFPSESIGNLNLVANFGLVLFLFIVGLELDPRIFKRSFRRSIPISAAGIVLPFGLGTAVSYALFKTIMGGEGRFAVFLLFIGVAMGITAFPVLGRILTEKNLLKTTVGMTAMSAAAIDDVVSWCLLALVIALTNNASGLAALWVFLVGAGYKFFVLLGVRPVYVWYLRHNGVLGGREPKQSVLFVTFAIVLVSAFFTDIIGIHAIFGAFIIGVIVPHDGGFAIKVAEKIEDVVQIFFLPVYFTLSGLKTNLADLSDGTTWGLFFLACFVASFGKIVGCAAAARFNRFTWRESLTIGFMMNCKGLIEVIILNIGLDAGVINTKIFNMMVLMTLVTTVCTLPMVAWLYPARYQRRVDDAYSSLDGDSLSEKGADAAAGHPVNVLVVLSRMQQVPALMALLGYLHRQPGAPSGADATPFANVRRRLYRPIRVFGLRLLELTDRDSSFMQSYEATLQAAADPAMAMFRAFARVAHMAFHASLSYSDREHFVENILHSSQDADAEVTIVSAFGHSCTTTTTGTAAAAAAAATGEAAGKRPGRPAAADVMAPGWFESMGWGLSIVQQAAFIAALYDCAQNNFCVFVDCGLAEPSEPTPLTAADASTAAPAAASPGGAAGPRVAIAADGAPLPGVPATYFADGRRVPVVLVPFFGGPDDRQAVRMAADLCTHSAVHVVVWRLIKAGQPGPQQTPAPALPREGTADEPNPWERTLEARAANGSKEQVSPGETSIESERALGEAAEREEDELFIATHLRPSDPGGERRGRRASIASARSLSETPRDASASPLSQVATRDTAFSIGMYSTTSGGDDEGGARGRIRHRITQRLLFRRLGTHPTADSTPGAGGWDDVDGVALTATDGVRATRYPNMVVKTTVTATPLQTLLLHARALRAADLILCGRSVRVSRPYFSNAGELEAHRPAGHAGTRAGLQKALGAAAESLLESGSSASLLVVQAAPDPPDADVPAAKRGA